MSACCDPSNQRHDDDTLGMAVIVHDALAELVRLVELRDRNCICCHDVSVTQARAIEALHLGASMTLNELATALYLDKSTTSRVVDTLVRKGYVTRDTHPEDRRAIALEVSRSGRELHHRIRRTLISEVAELLEELTPETRRGMAKLLSRFVDRMKACAGFSDPSRDPSE